MRAPACLVVAMLAVAGCCFAAPIPESLTVKPTADASTFVAIPPAERGLHHVNLGLYFPSAVAEQTDRKRLLTDIAAFPATAPTDATAFEAWLQRAGTLRAQLIRHDVWLQLRASMNTDDQAASDGDDQIGDAGGRLMAAFDKALRAVNKGDFARMVAETPTLTRYAFVLDTAQRDIPHRLPADQQKILNAVADPALSGWWKLYQDTVRGTRWAKLRASDGRELDVRKDAKALALDPDRATREAAWRGRIEGYASHEDSYADILLGIVQMHQATARLRHFADAPSEVYFDRYLSRGGVGTVLRQLASSVTFGASILQTRVGVGTER